MASWNKLADRCKLFTDRPRALIIELLKEAEEELVRKCDILEKSHEFTAPLHLSRNYDVLPNNYKKEIAVYHKGVKLNKMSQEEVVLNTSNEIYTGTPTSYWIEGNQIHFNKKPSDGDNLKIYYYSNIGNNGEHTLRVHELSDGSPDTIKLDTSLGEELVGFIAKAGLAVISITSFVGVFDSGSKYEIIGADMATDDSTLDIIITNYRSVAPIIPDHFHRNLCDYAIALSTPELHDKHMIMFENSINEIKNEDAERDLIHEVKKEVYNSANLYR